MKQRVYDLRKSIFEPTEPILWDLWNEKIDEFRADPSYENLKAMLLAEEVWKKAAFR